MKVGTVKCESWDGEMCKSGLSASEIDEGADG